MVTLNGEPATDESRHKLGMSLNDWDESRLFVAMTYAGTSMHMLALHTEIPKPRVQRALRRMKARRAVACSNRLAWKLV